MSLVPPPIAADAPATSGWADVLRRWIRRRPVEPVLVGLLIGSLFYFFAVPSSVRTWAPGPPCSGRVARGTRRTTWNTGWAIMPGGAGDCLVSPPAIASRRRSRPPGWALIVAFAGAATFLYRARALQPRIALVAIPIVIYGSVLYLWGRATARLILFPCAFLLFMVPMGFLVSRTVGLQTLAATVAARLSSIFGIGVVADGTILRAVNGSFEFEVAGGCSGIRSLTAMTVLAALFVHFTQKGLWKKAVIFAGSLFFALVGNLGPDLYGGLGGALHQSQICHLGLSRLFGLHFFPGRGARDARGIQSPEPGLERMGHT